MRLAYAVHGSGPPLVRVATWLSHLELEWESPVWRHWLKQLGDRNTVVRYDERGCGLSDKNIGDPDTIFMPCESVRTIAVGALNPPGSNQIEEAPTTQSG